MTNLIKSILGCFSLMLFILIAFLISCSGDKSITPHSNYESFTVGLLPDTIVTRDGKLTLYLPANALESETTITIAIQNSHPGGDGFIDGSCYELEPTGLHFKQPISLEISYNDANVPVSINKLSLRICKATGNIWQQVTFSTVDTLAKNVHCDIHSFSSYGVIGWSGDIYAGDFMINNTTTISAFSQYHGITGNLNVTASESLSTLDGLVNLEWIGGNLTINHSYYDSIPLVFGNGFSALTVIGGNFLLSNKTLLTATLPLLNSIGGSFTIAGNKLDSLHFPNLRAIGVWLKVYYTRALANLNGLGSLSSVGKGIWIEATRVLANLEGIENVGPVDSIYIAANRDLQNIRGIEGITYIRDNIELNNNDALTRLLGFNASYVGGITIAYNDNLTTLGDLARLSSVGKNGLNIQHQNSISSLRGLEGVDFLAGNFSLWYCNSLDTIDAPTNLLSCYGLFIADCNSLVSLKALETITHVAATLEISQCNSLRDLSGLRNLNTIGGDIRIRRNPYLNNLDGFTNLIFLGTVQETGGGAYLENNVRLGDITGLHNLRRGGGTGYAVPGTVYIVNNIMSNASAWAFINAIGGDTAVRDTIIIRDN